MPYSPLVSEAAGVTCAMLSQGLRFQTAKAGGVCTLQTLYESSIAFGMRKALQTEAGKSDMEQRINTLEAEAKDLERQVEL